MSVYVCATVPLSKFAFQDTLQAVPGSELELVRSMSSESVQKMPLLLATADDQKQLLKTIGNDPSIQKIEMLSDMGDDYLFEVEWASPSRRFLRAISGGKGRILSGIGMDRHWRFLVHYSGRQAVSSTYDCYKEFGIEFNIEEMSEISDGELFGLSETQYERLISAYKGGFFAVPGTMDCEDLAERHDVTHQSISKSIRRGHKTLIENSLFPPFSNRMGEDRARPDDIIT